MLKRPVRKNPAVPAVALLRLLRAGRSGYGHLSPAAIAQMRPVR